MEDGIRRSAHTMAEREATSFCAKPLYNDQKRIREGRKSEQPTSSGNTYRGTFYLSVKGSEVMNIPVKSM
jgi:hypothetical protein